MAVPPGSLLPLLEPPPAVRSPSCERSQCVAAAAQAPSPHFPAPFERCPPSLDTGDPLQEMSFSPRLTGERRAAEPGVCCYRVWVACPGKGAGRPLLRGGGQAWAPLRPDESWG